MVVARFIWRQDVPGLPCFSIPQLNIRSVAEILVLRRQSGNPNQSSRNAVECNILTLYDLIQLMYHL